MVSLSPYFSVLVNQSHECWFLYKIVGPKVYKKSKKKSL